MLMSNIHESGQQRTDPSSGLVAKPYDTLLDVSFMKLYVPVSL